MNILNNFSHNTINQIDNHLILINGLNINSSVIEHLSDYLEDIADIENAKDELLTGYSHHVIENRIFNLKQRRKEDKQELKKIWELNNPEKDFLKWLSPITHKLMTLQIKYNKNNAVIFH